MAAFGPEILSASTICGTKKGGRKKKTEDQVVKPGLDKEILNAVRGMMYIWCTKLNFILRYFGY